MSADDRDSEPAVAVVCGCRGFVMIAVRKYLGDTDKADIGAYVARGLEVRQLTVGETRGLPWCECPGAQP